jgi:tRNA(Arg) A34 adenosine deaminase TadA
MKTNLKASILTPAQLDAAVHEVQLAALRQGMIPIAAILSRRLQDGRHEVLGAGCNHLAEGIPGIHGETGAIINMGRRAGGYAEVVATSSLSPCPFCQCTMVRHLGIREVRILDDLNYRPDKQSYAGLAAQVESLSHKPIEKTFGAWLRTVKNRPLWARDIGEFDGPVAVPFALGSQPRRRQQVLALAHTAAAAALARGEAPIGAVVLDAQGEVIGCGGPQIIARNDPTLVAAMSAWRACGAREHWMDKTLVLTVGPDAIAYSMFQIFNFGQLIVASDAVFAGYLSAVRALNRHPQRHRPIPVRVLRDTASDSLLKKWLRQAEPSLVREYLGANWPERPV